ncbi:Chloroplast stem-loop binding protein of 41 kDa b [Durusdinium trenchii]
MGGTRFIGCYLVAKLRALGHQVVVCNRGKTNGGLPERLPGISDAEYQQMLEGVTVLRADRKQPEELKRAISAAGKFDVVFDNNVRKLEEIQPVVRGVKAKGGCQQFIMMSSAGVYGPTDVLPLSEATPGDPKSRHKDKLACEKFLQSEGLNWTSIRPVYIYGPLNYNPVERYFFDRVTRGRPVCVPYGGKYITQLGHCEDLADFMVKCVGNGAVNGQVYNVSSQEYVTFDGMAKVCAEAAGITDPKIVHYDPKSIEVPEGYPKAFPFRGMHFFASIEKAKRHIPSWKPKYNMLNGLRSSYEQDYLARGFHKKDPDFRTDDLILQKMGVSVGSSKSSASGAVRHNSGFSYSYNRDAFADLEFGNDVGYLPDGTPMHSAGNAMNHPETIGPDPHSPGAPLPRANFVNDVGYLPDGTPLNKAGNAINHPENIPPDPHAPGSALPESAYAAEVGYFVDGTPIDNAGNNAVR